MSTPLIKDDRLKEVQWKDLLYLTRREIAVEILLSLPWLVGSCVLAYFHLYLPALVFVPLFLFDRIAPIATRSLL
ncbi:MAG: hypothetical protein IPH42_07220 [Bacteroidetes bacterium]|nr:hypothetical protein [Bacteroidota bacterium]